MIVLCGLAVLLAVPFLVVYKPPSLLIRYFEYRWPGVIWRVQTSAKTIALTIDDSPSELTQELLQVLQENNASATFFVIGSQALGREQILEDIVRHGHELGNHAMRDEPSRSLSDKNLVEQIQIVEEMIRHAYEVVRAGESAPKYFRPGSGFFSERMQKTLDGLGYRLVLGNVYPHDPQIPFWRINARHVLSMLQPGAIMICHDRRSWTLPMLRKVLPEFRRRGYRVTTLTDLMRHSPTAAG